MQPEALFGMALGIVSPWEVTEVIFSKESSRLGPEEVAAFCERLEPVISNQVE